MPVAQSFNKILLTTSNTAENNILLQEISGQLYINNHLVVTADNIASLTTVTNIESDVSTLQTDTTSLQTSVSTLQTQVDNITKYNISTRDTEANILASSPTNPTGEVTIAYGTDTQDIYIWDGSAWYVYHNDSLFTNTYSLNFDGSDDYVSITQDGSINISGDITLSAWINRTKTTSYNAIFTKRQVGSSMNYQFTIDNSNGRIGLGHSGGSWVYNTTTTLSTNTWYHVAVTVSSGTAQFYVNGVAEDSFTGVSITATTHDLIIGATLGYNNFGGNIDEAAIFNSALSASDITTIYNSGAPADISSLNPVGWWRMGDNDGGTGTTITDQGSGGNNGTLTNGPTFSTDVPGLFANTYSLSFDGTNDYMDCSATFTSLWSGSFSISLWLKTPSSFTSGVDNYLGNDFVVGQGYIEFRQRQINSSSAKIEVYFGNSVTGGNPYGTYGAETSAVLSTNSWYHLVLTADRPSSGTTTVTLYVDGSATTLNSIAGYLSSIPNAGGTWSNNTLIGARNNTSSGSGSGELFLEGHLDEIAFFNSVLSSSDVSTIYNGGVPNDISSLNPFGWWRMGDNDGGTGTTITDQGSGGNNGTLTNGPTFSTTVPS